MINTPAQWKLLHTWILLVIVKQHLVHVGRIDGPAEHLSQILAAIRFARPPRPKGLGDLITEFRFLDS